MSAPFCGYSDCLLSLVHFRVVKRILCYWLHSGGNISFLKSHFFFFTLTTKRNVIISGIPARWSLKWFPQLPTQPYPSRTLIDSPSLSLSLRGSARDRLCWVVVSGLVVLLLYNKPGWLADHSPTELWVLAQSSGSITSSHPQQPDAGSLTSLSLTFRKEPPCLFISFPLLPLSLSPFIPPFLSSLGPTL